MWAIPTGASWLLKKKKNQVKSPSPESRVSKTGSDPPIGSDRDSGRDCQREGFQLYQVHIKCSLLESCANFLKIPDVCVWIFVFHTMKSWE